MSNKRYYIHLGILAILCIFGGLGMQTSERVVFVDFTPYSLLIIATILIINHEGSIKPLISFFLMAFEIGMMSEVVGVKYGVIFGNYSYGTTLGWKILDVPFTIGVNWFILSYTIFFTLINFFKNRWALAIVGALGMVAFDFVMEPGAIELGFWSWENSIIPVSNYTGWFFVSFILMMLMPRSFWNSRNRLAIPVLLFQLFFFLLFLIF